MTDSIAATRILVDTNILIYAADLHAGDKNLRAVELVDDLTAQNRMVVSAQVLNDQTITARQGKVAHVGLLESW